MLNLQKPLLAYMTYPLSSNPKKNGKKALALALALMALYSNLHIIIARARDEK